MTPGLEAKEEENQEKQQSTTIAVENPRPGGQRRKKRKNKTMRVDCDRKSPAWRPKKERNKKNNKCTRMRTQP